MAHPCATCHRGGHGKGVKALRALQYFSIGEWLQILPLQHAAKQWRNDAWLAVYRRRRASGQAAFLRQVAPFADGNVALVIAFESPWVTDWQLTMARRHLTDAQVLVFDNSRSPARREEIERVCARHGAPYLALPRNRTRHVNRSHGMAMSWVFSNIVRPLAPRRFAFLDHDLIPLLPISLSERLGRQPFFGYRGKSSWGWSLWAGYCLFDFAHVKTLPLNFLYDFSNGLDTGGRNWKPLYRRHDATSLRFAEDEWVELASSDGTSPRVQVLDGAWLHIGGISYNRNFDAKAALCERLARTFHEGRTWHDLRTAGLG